MQDLITAISSSMRRSRNSAPVPYVGRSSTLFDRSGGGAPSTAAYDAYGSVGTLFAIVKQIGDAFAPVEWHLYRKTSVRDKKRRQEVTSHAFLDVWNNPNPFYTGSLFRETVQQHVDLVGEGYIVLYEQFGIVMEMWPVRPDRMEPVKDPDEFLKGWIYKSPDGEKVPLETSQVIQIRYPNPKDPYRGIGPVQTVLSDVEASKYAADWNRNFFINGARPGGVIEVDHVMGDDEWNQFLKRWRTQHQGVANAHRVAVLENAKWVDTNFSMEDMQFVELRNLPRELIREAFAFPKPMLGTVDDVNRANAQAGKEIMADNQTAPRLRRWRDIINNKLVPRFANGKNLEADFDDPTPLNVDDQNNQRNSQASSAAALVGAGYDPDDVTDAMGLPRMRFVGKPGTPAQQNGDPQSTDISASTYRS